MGFNYGYKLNDNPKLTSLGEISFEPITEEHIAIVDREIKRYRAVRKDGVFKSIIFFIIGLALAMAAVWVGIMFINARALAFLPGFTSLFFIALAVVNLLRCVSVSVNGIKKGVVADRETHEFYIDDAYGNPEVTSTDRVTVRFPEIDKEVSVVCDARTQMHCIPGKTVYLLRTSRGIIISYDD